MKHLSEYRDGEKAKRLAGEIARLVTRPWAIMEVCGGQTHSIIRNGIDQILPDEIEMIHGPGCPVCVTPLEVIDKALAIAARPEVIFCSFGDMLRVPGSKDDLFKIKGAGGDVRVIYSPLDALNIARENPHREVVFLAIGFETTAPANAMAVKLAKDQGIHNYSALVSHVLVPPAIEAIMNSPGNRVTGFLAAGHVCCVTGLAEYPRLCDEYGIPIVVSGFEPLDLLEGIRRTVIQLESGRASVENAYPRVVSQQGNVAAQAVIDEVFEVTDRGWRGIGTIPNSGWRLSDAYRDFDAETKFTVSEIKTCESPLCRAGEVLKGAIKPNECEAFGKECTPRNPLGATMVSSEGACAAYFNYGRFCAVGPSEISASCWRAELSNVTDTNGRESDPESPPRASLDGLSCPLPLQDYPNIILGHGGGGKLSAELVEHIFLPAFENEYLAGLADAAVFSVNAGRLAFSTDSYVVQPLFFPGGSIGDLAVNGTVNDLSMSGAKPIYLSAGFIIEEGFPVAQLQRIADDMGAAARRAGVAIITGDTKVVERGHGDGVYINTAGVGVVPEGLDIAPANARPGDVVIVSGTLGDHGMAIMSVREGLEFEAQIESDSAPLNEMVAAMIKACPGIRVLRDPTRGGLAASLNEIAAASKCGIVIEESCLPIEATVQSACEILGLDPLLVANEGKLVCIVPAASAAEVLAAIQSHPAGVAAAVIGKVVSSHPSMVVARTSIGASRVITIPIGEQLPRIC